METLEQYLDRTDGASDAANAIASDFVNRIMSGYEAGDESKRPDIVRGLALSLVVAAGIIGNMPGKPERGRAYRCDASRARAVMSRYLGRIRSLVLAYVSGPDEVMPRMASLPNGVTETDVWNHVAERLVRWVHGAVAHCVEHPDHTPETCAVSSLLKDATMLVLTGAVETLPEA